MAENDNHYNDMPVPQAFAAGGTGQNGAEPAPLPDNGISADTTGTPANGSGMPDTPANGGGTPVITSPDNGIATDTPDTPANGDGTPVITYPDPGEGEGTPVIPYPDPGEGGGTPVITYLDPGEGGGTPVITYPDPGGNTPVFPGGAVIGGITWIPSYPGCSACLPPQSFGQVRFLNASATGIHVNISIDGTAYVSHAAFGTISDYDWVADGFHTVTVRRATGLRTVLLQQTFPFTAGQKVTLVLTDSVSGGLQFVRVIDTGCSTLPVGSGCYRFANMSYSGSSFDLIMQSRTPVFRGVGYQAVTTYKQAVAGIYEFTVTNARSLAMEQELPVIMIGASDAAAGMREPVLSFLAGIEAGGSFTSYLIGNTWSNAHLHVLTVQD